MITSPKSVQLESGDQVAMQYLAAAVAFQWKSLPVELQNLLLDQASGVIGLPFQTGLHESIKSFIRRNENAKGVNG